MEPAFASSERINRETGVNPVRSRHCIREFHSNDVTGLCIKVSLGRRCAMMILSQENCLQMIQMILTVDKKQLIIVVYFCACIMYRRFLRYEEGSVFVGKAAIGKR